MTVRAKAKSKPSRKKRQDEIRDLMSEKAQRKAERAIRHALDDMDARADEYVEYADAILAINSPEITELVEGMVEKMRAMQGQPRFTHDGITVNVEPELIERINEKIHRWFAVRMLVACAEWDIQIGNFKLPDNLCYRCAKKVRRA